MVHHRLFLIALSLLVGCATPVGVRRVDERTVQQTLTANVLSTGEPSTASSVVLQTLGHLLILRPVLKIFFGAGTEGRENLEGLDQFILVAWRSHTHNTPWGSGQSFQYSLLRVGQ